MLPVSLLLHPMVALSCPEVTIFSDLYTNHFNKGYKLAVDTYCRQGQSPLPVEMLEKTVLNSAMSSYDAASNGNRTRGGVRKASDMYELEPMWYCNRD